ncbi:MAG TPA: Ig-like domain-containing protein, partial [bacterium]|nr:Ig-like domain-containing protein [bacterium]
MFRKKEPQGAVPEQDPELTQIVEDIQSVMKQEIPERSEFKKELDDKVSTRIEEVTGKKRAPRRSYAWAHLAGGLKSLLHFPWPRWAYATASFMLFLGVAGGLYWLGEGKPGVDTVMQTVQQSFSPQPVFADAEIILIKENDTERGVSPDGAFLLKSKKPLDRASFADRIQIEPAIAGEFTWSDDSTEVTFVPAASLSAGTNYQVTVDPGAKNAEGEEFGRELQWSFQTVPDFVITGTTPEHKTTSAPRDTTIEIEFNYRSISADTFAQYFQITPETSGRFEAHDNKIVFLPDQPLAAEVVYKATVLATLPNNEGQTLEDDYSWEFLARPSTYINDTYVPDPWLDFSLGTGGVATWMTSGSVENKEIMVYLTNWPQGDLKFSLYKTDMQTLLAQQVWPEDGIPQILPPPEDKLEFVQDWEQNVAETAVSTSMYSPRDQEMKVQMPALGDGVYYLRVVTDVIAAPRFVYIVSSDTTIRYRKDETGESLFWLVDQQSGQPLPNQSLTLYQLENALTEIATVTTDSSGIYRTAEYPDIDVAISGGAVIFLRTGREYYGWYDYMYWRFGSSDMYKAAFALDRPLYKPDDEVNYKVVLRKRGDGELEVLPKGTKVYLRVNAWFWGGGEPIIEQEKTIDNDFGTVSGTFRIPSTIDTGTQYLQAVILNGDEEEVVGSQEFEVQFYRKPDYELSVAVDREEVISGDGVNAEATVSYFFGEPVAGAEVSYRVFAHDYYEPQPGAYETGDVQDYWYGGDTVKEGKETLNDQGVLQISIDTNLGGSESSRLYGIEVEYVDNLQVTNYANANIIVHRGNYFVIPEPAEYSRKVGENINLDINLYDSLTKEGYALDGELRLYVTRQWYEVQIKESTCYDPALKREKVCQIRDYIEHTETVFDGKTVPVANTDFLTYSFPAAQPGSYQMWLKGTDSRGNTISSRTTYAWVTDGSEYNWWRSDGESIAVYTDKDTYEVGDTAVIKVVGAENGGQVLVMVHQEEFQQVRVLNAPQGEASFELPITGAQTPNFMISVEQPVGETFATLTQDISVSMEYKKLDVELGFEDKEYLPADEVNLDITVKDAQGNGTQAEVVLYLVDKALLALKEDYTPDWFKAFYSHQYNYLQTRASSEDAETFMAASGAEGGGCFLAGTPVQTPEGEKAIETLQPGDTVYSYDLGTSQQIVNQVSKLLVHEKYVQDPLLRVTFADGSSVQVTANHTIYNPEKGIWQSMGDFAVGDSVLLVRQGTAQLLAITQMQEVGRNF